MMGRVAEPALLCLLVLFANGCMSSNHDALAASDAGQGVVLDASGNNDGDAAADGASDGDDLDAIDELAADQSSDTEQPIQPDGPSRFTFVHGIADVPALRVCFAAGSGSNFQLLPAWPLPEEPAGLSFARSFDGDALPGSVDLELDDVRPVVFTGDLSKLDGKQCNALATPPEGVTATSLPVLPAGTLAHGRSVLMVAAGCVGGFEHTDGAQESICGLGYRPNQPTATLLVATMDRVPADDGVGLQVFAASLGTTTVQVDHTNAVSSTRTTIATAVPPGAIAPKPPIYEASANLQGTDPATNVLEVFESDPLTPSVSVPFEQALLRGGLTLADLEDGRNLTVIVAGPRAGMIEGTWWNAFTATVVRSDP